MEFETIEDGIVGDLLVAEGQEGIKVGTVIATLSVDGEEASESKTPCGNGRGYARNYARICARAYARNRLLNLCKRLLLWLRLNRLPNQQTLNQNPPKKSHKISPPTPPLTKTTVRDAHPRRYGGRNAQ